MFFVLSKILLFLIQPLNWIIVFLVIGYLRRDKKWGKRFLVTGVSMAVFFTNPLAINIATRAWELEPVLIESIEEPFDVGIVLGGFSRINEDFPDRIHLNNHPNRLIHTIQLYQAGKIKKILITNGSPALVGKKLTDNDILRKFLTRSGIPDLDILTEKRSRNTRENAVYSAEILSEYPAGSRYLLITSASHMRRASACFRKAGIEVTPFVTDQTENAIDSPTPGALIIPKAGALSQWNMLIKEWVGYAAYKFRGYL